MTTSLHSCISFLGRGRWERATTKQMPIAQLASAGDDFHSEGKGKRFRVNFGTKPPS